MKKFLVIQTAFIGDVILATSVIEAIHKYFDGCNIDFLLRKGNEGLLKNHPYISKILIWDKKQGKYSQMLKIIRNIRKNKYDVVINLQRFLSTGIITVFSGARETIGFSKNPLSLLFKHRYPHIINKNNSNIHEIDRNISLLQSLIPEKIRVLPKLYPSEKDYLKVPQVKKFITISPTSVWYTKQYPPESWIKLINLINPDTYIYLLGGKDDVMPCEWIKNFSYHPKVEILAGKLSFLESAALMKNAVMNYVNDSAPLHIASSMNAPVTAVFCSTIPAFGFGPLSDNSKIVETKEKLPCRPCGLHGYRACPEKHFKCSDIEPAQILGT